MILVGTFNEEDIKTGADKRAVEKAKKETGLNYVNTKIVSKKGVPVGLKVWVCGINEWEV